MARVTVEDCMDKVSSRFELVLLASRRARDILSGVPTVVDADNDKSPVIALREIASASLNVLELREKLVCSARTKAKLPEIDRDSSIYAANESLNHDKF